jgi:carboxyl-terminal processing protease
MDLMEENLEKETNTESEMEAETAEANLKKARKLFLKYLLFFAVIFVLLGSSFWLGLREGRKQLLPQADFLPVDRTVIENKFPTDGKSVDFGLFWKVWDILKIKYVDKASLDAQKLIYGAINGMLKATGDPYSTFFNPEETKNFNEDLGGSFEGIGAELGMKDDVLTVIAPLENSPAQKAGLRTGDKILKIGEKTTTDMNVYAAVDLIRGEKGTEIKLTIYRQGEEGTKEISIIRDTIEVKSVILEFKEKVAYVRITKFGEETDKEFDKIANEIIMRGATGLVLDLRNNPGGFLERSITVASRLIPKDRVVVIEEDSTGKRLNLNTQGGDKLNYLPIVVLINEGSASASEILAGALRDDLGIKLVGKKSFGKGSVQELMNLPGDSSVKITVAKWLTPKGDYIMEKGILPDVEVNLTMEDFNKGKDPQLDKALEIIREEITKKATI